MVNSSNQTEPIESTVNDVVGSTDISIQRRNRTEEDRVNEKLVKTLKEMVKPKDFKDIFFDDDDLSEEGSGK